MANAGRRATTITPPPLKLSRSLWYGRDFPILCTYSISSHLACTASPPRTVIKNSSKAVSRCHSHQLG